MPGDEAERAPRTVVWRAALQDKAAPPGVERVVGSTPGE
jgi:hypothetical protein